MIRETVAGALKSLYRDVKRAHLGAHAGEVPEEYWSQFVCVGNAAETLWIIREKLIGASRQPLRILVVGVFGGRDYWGLRLAGHDVVGLDLAPVPACPTTVAGDAEAVWPFPDASFDAVIMCEVLEHLVLDRHSLAEAKRILRSSGILVGSVPFLHDNEEHHVRVHTPESLVRLLRIGGFTVDDIVERPGVINLACLNYVNHAFAAAYYAVTSQSLYQHLVPLYGRLEWRLGHVRWLPRAHMKILRLVNWGATFKARPVGEALDYKRVNRERFTPLPQDVRTAGRRSD